MMAVAVACARANAQQPPEDTAAPDPKLEEMLRKATDIGGRFARQVKRSTTYYWSVNGHAGQLPKQVNALRTLASELPERAVVCEIGFNGGHSAIMWLEGTRTHTLLEFDVMSLLHSNASRAFVEQAYPGRTRFFVGDSAKTFATYADAVEDGCMPPCDLIMADGDHRALGAFVDYYNAVRAAHGPGSSRRTVFVGDDVTPRFRGVLGAYTTFKKDGVLRQRNCTALTHRQYGLKGWCVAEVERPPGWVAAFPQKLKPRSFARRAYLDLRDPRAAHEARRNTPLMAEMQRTCAARSGAPPV